MPLGISRATASFHRCWEKGRASSRGRATVSTVKALREVGGLTEDPTLGRGPLPVLMSKMELVAVPRKPFGTEATGTKIKHVDGAEDGGPIGNNPVGTSPASVCTTDGACFFISTEAISTSDLCPRLKRSRCPEQLVYQCHLNRLCHQ